MEYLVTTPFRQEIMAMLDTGSYVSFGVNVVQNAASVLPRPNTERVARSLSCTQS